MSDQQTIERIQQEVHTSNKEKVYHQDNTTKLHKVKDIYKASNGLDNISELNMKKFNEIMGS
jgi:hypothetical protein